MSEPVNRSRRSAGAAGGGRTGRAVLRTGGVAALLAAIVAVPCAARAPRAALVRRESPQPRPGRVDDVQGDLSLVPAATGTPRRAGADTTVVPGDVVRTPAGSGATLELVPSWWVQLGPSTELRYRLDGRGIELLTGTAVACSGLDAPPFYLQTEDLTAWLGPGGSYRAELRTRRTVLSTTKGLAEVASGWQVHRVKSGRQAVAALDRSLRVHPDEVGRLPDETDELAEEACDLFEGEAPGRGLVGIASLRDHGAWLELEDGTMAWRPASLPAGWRPFGQGGFRHHPTVGWVFEPDEPWGWVTHHHGRFVLDPTWGWLWLPGGDWVPHDLEFLVEGDRVYWWAPLPAESASPPGGVPVDGRVSWTDLQAFDVPGVTERPWRPEDVRAVGSMDWPRKRPLPARRLDPTIAVPWRLERTWPDWPAAEPAGPAVR